MANIQVDIRSVRYHPSRYLAPRYLEIMLDIKDVDIRPNY
jgi:hypothetical protein